MNRLIVLFTTTILFACSNSDDINTKVELVGNWRLIEVLADPGDGSGTFATVQSNKMITFEPDGVITSNGNLCDMSISSNMQTSGTYSKTNLTFKSDDCQNPNHDFTFEQNSNIIIINYPCIEPCMAKYKKT